MSNQSWLLPLASQFGCYGYLLNSGTFQSVVSPDVNSTTIWNQTMGYPAWFVNCTDSRNLTGLADALTSVVRSTNFSSQKIDFRSGNLVLAFVLCGVSIGGWMLFLLLFLLPTTNHNRQHLMVHLYVLFFSVVQSIFWKETNDKVFNTQYSANYQDVKAFQNLIVDTVWAKVLRFLSLFFCDINWIIVIGYLSSVGKDRHCRSKWCPKYFSNYKSVVFCLFIALSLIHVVFFGIEMFDKSTQVTMWSQVPFRVIQLCLVSLFVFSLAWHSFRSLSSASSSMDSVKLSKRRKMLVFLNEYKEIVPLLVYNIMIFLALYLAIFVELLNADTCSHWIPSVLGFIRILIFVNTWGLIGKLEKRERKVSKKSLLGRKINNNDRFFVDPKINYGDQSNENPDPDRRTKGSEDPGFWDICKRIFLPYRKSVDDAGPLSEDFPMQNMDPDSRHDTKVANVNDHISADTESLDTVLTRNVIYDHNAT